MKIPKLPKSYRWLRVGEIKRHNDQCKRQSRDKAGHWVYPWSDTLFPGTTVSTKYMFRRKL